MNKFELDIRSDRRPKGLEKPQSNYYGEFAQEFQVTYTPVRSGIFNIWLFGGIYCATQFIYAIEALQAASENDVVYINLSTDGGSLDATDTFLMAMQECEAKIVIKASGGVHSAGTVILMHADEFILSENFNALVHNGSVGPGGKFSDWVSASKHTKEYMETVMRNTYAGFLTETEIDNLLAGHDYWFGPEEFVQRFESRVAYMEEQHEELQAAYVALMEQAAKIQETPKKTPRKRKPTATIVPLLPDTEE